MGRNSEGEKNKDRRKRGGRGSGGARLVSPFAGQEEEEREKAEIKVMNEKR